MLGSRLLLEANAQQPVPSSTAVTLQHHLPQSWCSGAFIMVHRRAMEKPNASYRARDEEALDMNTSVCVELGCSHA